MKKWVTYATLAFGLAGCYTPLNNSGVATTKSWLEIESKKVDFNGNQYDSCYRFNVRFWPQEAVERIDLQTSCISTCCWRNDKEEVVLDFNKNFESDLALYGRARKYAPEKITLKVNHSNLLNTTRVTISPKGAVTNDGLIKLSYKETDNPQRLAQLEAQSRQLLARRNAYLIEQAQQEQLAAEEALKKKQSKTVRSAKKSPVAKTTPKATAATKATLKKTDQSDPAKNLVQRKAGAKIDTYFYQMDKRYKKQEAVFMLSDRLLYTQPMGVDDTYLVSCLAKARTGLDTQNLRASTFSCGQWKVDLTTQEVSPYDKRAQLIWSLE